MARIGTSEIKAACDRALRKRGLPVQGMREIANAEARTRQKPAAQRERINSIERAAREIERRSRG